MKSTIVIRCYFTWGVFCVLLSATPCQERGREKMFDHVQIFPKPFSFPPYLQAHEAAHQQQRCLLVSIHDESCFDCHVLNRDVWKDYRVSSLIRKNFLFVQVIFIHFMHIIPIKSSTFEAPALLCCPF